MELAGRRATVMGLGRFGGGLGVARWLAAQGADVLVTDLDAPEKLTESVATLQDLIDAGSVRLRLGEHNVSDFTTCDLVVANPAVAKPWENRFLRAAKAAGIPVTTEIGLVVERLPDRARVIGVTGTAGKSTTAALIAHILTECGQSVELSGNIGGSLLDRIGTMDPRTWIVLELSSFMLHWLAGWSPHVAVVTNITPNHLDWHGSFEHYQMSKRAILDSQRAGGVAVLGASVRDLPTRAGVSRVVVAADARVGPLIVPGGHNQFNAACALRAVEALAIRDLDRGRAAAAAATFRGLPHRLQLIAEHGGVRFYNDSKSTTPEATILALHAFVPEGSAPGDAGAWGRIHLIAGGYDKGSDLSPVAAASADLKGLYTIGATGRRIAQELPSDRARTFHCETLEAAVEKIFQRLEPGDVVLLSPGCASWDQYTNYEQRGERFETLVRDRVAAAAGRV